MHAKARQIIDHNAMTFGEHLDELRYRLIMALLGLLPILILSLGFGFWLLEFLVKPAEDALLAKGLPPMLQATGPLETFGSYLRVSLALALVVASPWLLWQLWLFVAPGLYERERRFIYFLAPLSTLLTFIGAVFLYTVMLPAVLSFFIGFGTQVGARAPTIVDVPADAVFPIAPVLAGDPADPQPGQIWVNTKRMELRICIKLDAHAKPVVAGSPLHRVTGIAQQYRISEYTKLLFALTLAFVIGFQTPVVVLLLGWAGVIDPAFFKGKRKYAIMVCTVAAAVLTPPDPVSMIIMAFPLYALFELGVFLLKVMPAERIAGGLVKREGPDAGDA